MSLQDGLSGRVWKPGPQLKSAGRGLLDLVFPPLALDDGPRPMSAGLSAQAWMKITFIDGPVCDGCGTPFEFALGAGARCVACEARPRAFSRARAACLYDETSRDPILQFKHADRQDLAPLFARWLSRAADELVIEADAIIPVPLHRGRLFQRQFNQAAEIARGLARLRDRPYLPDALVRRRATESQGGKSGSGRRRNVAGAFVVPEGRAYQVAGRNILLVDDVLTTGATAQGCARALLAAGAARVDLAVVARVKAATTPS
ncbi:MAG: ComF family protein [Phenylobacterium sp.]|uniref:ComF family protein n=1 Tax=Phenylobacterium sp. TaxID=1871053 RepID=UPI0025D9E33E|nr:ComF family protein [Phenylobacterium sp.]MCG9917354.1 ComF family protein [Phenylobacterium sp.]